MHNWVVRPDLWLPSLLPNVLRLLGSCGRWIFTSDLGLYHHTTVSVARKRLLDSLSKVRCHSVRTGRKKK